MAASVVRISIAPIKALGLVHPVSVDLGPAGVQGDRRFWLVDEDGRLFNNKRHGPMVLISPKWDETTRELTLTFPDRDADHGHRRARRAGRRRALRAATPVAAGAGAVAEAISAHVGRPLTLLWSEQHATDRGVGGGSVSVVSRASLERLRAEAGADDPIDGRRFRMMFEIDGVAAHEEDEWIESAVEIGAARIVVNGDVGRCVVTSHDPDAGITDLDTLGTLARYRREGRFEPLPFGVYGSVTTPGRVQIGDTVRPANGR